MVLRGQQDQAHPTVTGPCKRRGGTGRASEARQQGPMGETDAGPGGVGAEPACSGGGGRWLRVRGSGHRASCHKRESLLLSAPVWRSGLRRLCV